MFKKRMAVALTAAWLATLCVIAAAETTTLTGDAKSVMPQKTLAEGSVLDGNGYAVEELAEFRDQTGITMQNFSGIGALSVVRSSMTVKNCRNIKRVSMGNDAELTLDNVAFAENASFRQQGTLVIPNQDIITNIQYQLSSGSLVNNGIFMAAYPHISATDGSSATVTGNGGFLGGVRLWATSDSTIEFNQRADSLRLTVANLGETTGQQGHIDIGGRMDSIAVLFEAGCEIPITISARDVNELRIRYIDESVSEELSPEEALDLALAATACIDYSRVTGKNGQSPAVSLTVEKGENVFLFEYLMSFEPGASPELTEEDIALDAWFDGVRFGDTQTGSEAEAGANSSGAAPRATRTPRPDSTPQPTRTPRSDG